MPGIPVPHPGDEFVTINGHRLRLRIHGDGPLTVFGHGLLGSIEQIEQALTGIDELHQHVRLLTYDARGHGQSAGPEDPAQYSWQALGEDMAAIIEHSNEPNAIVGGASMGAATALWVALERPGLVRALVLVMPPPLGFEHMRGADEHQALKALDLLAAAVQNFGLEATVDIARQMPGFAPTPEEAEERAASLKAQNPLAVTHAIRGLLQSPFHDPSEYRRIAVPTLIVAHEGDGLHPMRAAKLLHESIPNSLLLTGPNPSHWRTNPHEFIHVAREFLLGNA